MKKKLLPILALLFTAILVVGCNTTDKTEESEVEQNEPAKTAPEQTPTEDGTADEVQETPKSTEATPEQEVTYVQKGVDKSAIAKESKSVDQSYKIHQLPGFTLSQEEPGKDMIVSNDDDEVFMRIETITASESSYDTVKTSMQDYMNAVGDTVALSTEELSVFKNVQNIEGYVVDFDTEKVVGVVFEKDGLIAKVTIHDNDEQDLTAAMLAMAATMSTK